MIDSEKVNEIILNMKFKTAIFGGVTKESVYENMKSICDYYEEEIKKLEKKVSEVDQTVADVQKQCEQDCKQIKQDYISQVNEQQLQLKQIVKQCLSLEESMEQITGLQILDIEHSESDEDQKDETLD